LRKSIIIIGAGISGLAAGCYARMNGYEVTIFEKHKIPGGLCTSWKRKGYEFDLCIDWLGGVNPNEKDNEIWQELGALENKNIRHFDEFLSIREPDGRIKTYYTDPEKLRKELKSITFYEEDKNKIDEFCDAVENFIKAPSFDMSKPDVFQTEEDMKELSEKQPDFFNSLIKYNDVLIRDFYNDIKDRRLKEMISYVYLTPDVPFSLIPPIYTMSNLQKENMGFPDGGSMELIKSIENRYKELGGNVYYEKEVKEILINKNTAYGVKLDDLSEHNADIVVSACDAHSIIYKILGGNYKNEFIDLMYEEGSIFPSMLRVYIGVDMDFSDVKDNVIYRYNKILDFPGVISTNTDSMLIRHYCNSEPNFAPKGKSVLLNIMLGDYDYWKELSCDRAEYMKMKEKAFLETINNLEEYYPGIKEHVEAYDVVTPVTFERYTANYRGSIQGFIEDKNHHKEWLSKAGGIRMAGIDNFYMIGQWITLQGLLRCAGGGRYLAETLCNEDGKKFNVTKVI